jgi:23S rRNA (guanosine2251-2'-O)-methyltransferase
VGNKPAETLADLDILFMLMTIMAKRKHPSKPHKARNAKAQGSFWIYGVHAVVAALANPDRPCHRLLVADFPGQELMKRVEKAHKSVAGRPKIESVNRAEIEKCLSPGTVHQGLAVFAGSLPDVAIEDVIENTAGDAAAIVVLDQAMDPRNVGAVLRSTAAFGAAAVVAQERHALPITGALCKAASGAAEWVPLVRAVNLARALKTLKDAGYWCVGLDGGAKETLQAADLSGKVALVLGSEGEGLRRLTRESCDLLVRIPISNSVDSLNLSNAAAVALYEISRRET